ncbi:MAG: PD-(D/E)XK nuclease family protein [Chloroflexi bacterium]|nr:PD-(D/E)XK nuclease family protein [Chloroflexota bacterium]MCI0647534.1 PD-(D/E)XK nuclease family protein [Chloroflexota bacterium]MCI0730845.1 PD-(D/E)XK nuclease family protein [Chloroflexota bacterium]
MRVGEWRPKVAASSRWATDSQTRKLADSQTQPSLLVWLQQADGGRWGEVEAASYILQQRLNGAASPYDGDLSGLAAEFGRHFGPDQAWSASRLETYRTCGYYFFASNVLQLEPRPEPAEGLDIRQLGHLYHRIFEAVYRPPWPAWLAHPPEGDEAAVLAYVAAAAEPVLDRAPEQEGFRQTAWWQQTRQEIVASVARSVVQLARGRFTPWQMEARFSGETRLVLRDGADQVVLHGFIDRLDRNDAGQLRIIDYKSGSPSSYTPRDLRQGQKLQLPLYALAATEALGLGEVVDGFYWHFQQAEPSKVALASFEGGVAAAVETAVAYAWEAVRGARAGRFQPAPPDDKCPPYCPAAAFCWHYQPRFDTQ